MGTKVKELDNRHDGDRRLCPICTPRRKGRVSAEDLWVRLLQRGRGYVRVEHV